MERDDDTAVDGPVSGGVRAFVLGFLALVALCGLLSLEAWPLTGFRLYSEVRHRTRSDWELAGVSPDGTERVLTLKRLPVAYRLTARQISGFPSRTAAEREAMCDAWIEGFGDDGDEVASLRIYRATFDVVEDRKTGRELRYECGGTA